MKLGDFVRTTAVLALLLAACGGGNENEPDAPVLVPIIDAAPPPPDAFVCTLTDCDGACVDTTSDPLNCNGCGLECQTGASCQTSQCTCPPGFLPADLSDGFMEMVTDQFPGAYVALFPFLDGVINVAAVGYPTTGTMIGTPYTLTDQLGTPPFFLAGYNVDVSTFVPQAAFYAISGTLTFDTACISGATGTLTDATFQAVSGGLMNPTIDPAGCSFTVDTVTFDIGTPQDCP